MAFLDNISPKNKLIALFTSLISVGLILFFSTVLEFLTDFAYTYMDPNEDADQGLYIFIIKVTLILFIAFWILISFVLLTNLNKNILDFINSIVDTEKLQKMLFTDQLTSNKYLSKLVLVVTTIYAILLHLIYLVFGNIYDDGAGSLDENMAEYLSSFLLVISSIILFVAVFMLKKINAPSQDKKIIRIFLSGLSFMFLLVFMEEISWGQQIFQWETTGTLSEVNFQNETNLHNVIQPLLKFMYPLGGIGLFLILLLLWFFPKGKKPYWLNLITPHISLIYLAFFMACISFDGLLLSELFELLFYPFILFYCIRIFVCLKNPNKTELID